MKKIIALFTMLFLLFTVTACSNLSNLPSLDTPQISQYVENTFDWAGVENAESYSVLVDNNLYEVNGESFIAYFNESKQFSFRIKANGDNVNYSDSEWSELGQYNFEEEELLGGSYEDVSGIGMGIDVVTADTINTSIKLGASIFDQDQFDNITLTRVALQGDVGGNHSSTVIENITAKFSSDFSIGNGIEGTIEGFTAGVSSGFESSVTTSFSSYSNQYYYYQYQNMEKYSLSLPSFTILDPYIAILSDSFLNDVENLGNGIMTPEQFVDRYGTHLIASGIYGAKMEVFYSIVSDSEEIDVDTKTSIDSSVKAGVAGVFSGHASLGIDLSAAFGDKVSNVTTNFLAKGSGGSFIPTNSFESFSATYPTWADSLNQSDDDAVLIDFNDGGLIRIWDLFADNADAVGKLQQYVLKYAADTLAAENAKFDSTMESSDTYTSKKVAFRSNTYSITDSGRFHQKYDTVQLGSTFGIDIDKMASYGYTTVDILIELNVKEVNNGYQYIFIFANAAKDENQLLGEVKFQHSPGLDTSWWVHYSDELHFNSIPLSSFRNNQFILRYGASGRGSDTWENKDLNITLVFRR